MPITLVTGPANAGKARVVLDALRARLARGEEPLLVVPTRADVEHYRRELAADGCVLGARVERFAGLIGEAVRSAGIAERPLGALARERVLATVAARSYSQPELARRAGFVRALAAFVAELEVERVTPTRLREALGAWAAAHPESRARSVRAEELVALQEGYQQALAKLGRVDPERRAVQALDALRRKPALWRGTPVLFYGFDDLTRLQLDAVETLGRVVDAPVTVSLAYEPGRQAFAGRASSFQTLLPWASEHHQLPARAEYYAPAARAELHHLERSLLEPDAARAPSAGAVRLLEGGGERAELELAAGEIRALLDGGMQPADIALVHRRPASIATLLAEVLDAYEIPFALAHDLPFASTAVGGALCGLLRSALAQGQLEDLLAWLRAPGMLERPELADRLEARARRAGVDSATGARELWEREHWPLQALDWVREAAERGPLALIERATRELERLFNAPRGGLARELEAHELGEARGLAPGRRTLEELRELARADPALAPDLPTLVEILEAIELHVGEPTRGDAVAVLDPLALRARRVRALLLCGLQEGTFPAVARPEPFLSEEERRELAQISGLRLVRHDEALAAERYLLYATVSRPEELLVLSWHAAGDDGQDTAPSLFLDDICDLFAEDLRERRARRPLGAVEWPGPGVPPASWSARSRALAGPRLQAPRLRPLREPRLLGELREERLWSASSLETWANCPARWFVERLLRAQELQADAEPLARGGLAHAALKDTLEELRAQTGSARISPGSLAAARALLHAALDRRAPEYPLSVAPERVPGVRRRLEADLERYLEHAAAQGSELEPTWLELSFGFPEETDSPALPAFDLGDGARVRGRIDRVDVGPGGEAVVYDYKGVHAPEGARWVGERSIQVAIYMRVVEQLLKLRVVGGFYQPLSGRELRARGVLAGDAAVELECVNGDRRERADFDALLAETLALAQTAVREADAGMLEARPDTCGFGEGGCMYPTICRCER